MNQNSGPEMGQQQMIDPVPYLKEIVADQAVQLKLYQNLVNAGNLQIGQLNQKVTGLTQENEALRETIELLKAGPGSDKKEGVSD